MKCLIHYGTKKILWRQNSVLQSLFPFVSTLGKKGVPEMYTVDPVDWHPMYEKDIDTWGNKIIKPGQYAEILKTELENAREVKEEQLIALDPASYSNFYIETKDQKWEGKQYQYSNYWAMVPFYDICQIEEQLDELSNSQEAKQTFFQQMAISNDISNIGELKL